MNNSPSSYTREELKEAFEALYTESIKMTKRNMMLKNSLKNVTLEEVTLELKIAPMKT